MADYLFFLLFCFSLRKLPGDESCIFKQHLTGWINRMGARKITLWARVSFSFSALADSSCLFRGKRKDHCLLTKFQQTHKSNTSLSQPERQACEFVAVRASCQPSTRKGSVSKEFLDSRWKHHFFSSHCRVHFNSSPDVLFHHVGEVMDSEELEEEKEIGDIVRDDS